MDARKCGIRQMLGVVAVIALLFAAGCGSKMTAKTSGEKIFEADKAVSVVKEGNASVNAKNELAVAEEKLAKAKAAFAKEKFDEAARLSELVVVDAEYAGAKAATQKNLNILDEMKRSNDVLRQEIRQMSQ